MSFSHAEIKISNLRLRTYIGFNQQEREKQQDVVINIDVHYPPSSACRADTVEEALNYKTLTKQIITHVEQGRFLLLERLVSDLLAICTEQPQVSFARVTIDKPHALRFADSVSVSQSWQRAETQKEPHHAQ